LPVHGPSWRAHETFVGLSLDVRELREAEQMVAERRARLVALELELLALGSGSDESEDSCESGESDKSDDSDSDSDENSISSDDEGKCDTDGDNEASGGRSISGDSSARDDEQEERAATAATAGEGH
jgi:hypothetical protein